MRTRSNAGGIRSERARYASGTQGHVCIAYDASIHEAIIGEIGPNGRIILDNGVGERLEVVVLVVVRVIPCIGIFDLVRFGWFPCRWLERVILTRHRHECRRLLRRYGCHHRRLSLKIRSTGKRNIQGCILLSTNIECGGGWGVENQHLGTVL